MNRKQADEEHIKTDLSIYNKCYIGYKQRTLQENISLLTNPPESANMTKLGFKALSDVIQKQIEELKNKRLGYWESIRRKEDE